MRPSYLFTREQHDEYLNRGLDPERVTTCTRCRHETTAADDAGHCPECAELVAAEEDLASDPDFATVCDARRDGWIAALEADAEADLPEHPWSRAWTPTAALTPAVA